MERAGRRCASVIRKRTIGQMAFKDDAFDFQTPDWFRRRTEDQDGWFLQF